MASIKKLSVKQIYFYLVSLISLLTVLFAGQSALMDILRYYVLDTAPQYTSNPPFFNTMPYYGGPVEIGSKSFEARAEDNAEFLSVLREHRELTTAQKATIDNWFTQYEQWKQDQENDRKRLLDSLMGKIISVLIFTPVFGFHYRRARET